MNQKSKIGLSLFAVALLATVMAAGCASAPLRTEASTSGIRTAEEVGAAKVPQASLYVQLAKEELEQARVLAEKGDKKEADSMLLRAAADAELAVALSRGDVEKTEAERAIARVRQLRQENP